MRIGIEIVVDASFGMTPETIRAKIEALLALQFTDLTVLEIDTFDMDQEAEKFFQEYTKENK